MKGLLNMTLSSENGAIGTSAGAEAVQWPLFQAFLLTTVDLTWAPQEQCASNAPLVQRRHCRSTLFTGGALIPHQDLGRGGSDASTNPQNWPEIGKFVPLNRAHFLRRTFCDMSI